MASLCSLLAELLDQIIEYVLLHKRKAPANITAAMHNRWRDEELLTQGVRGFLTWAGGPQNVRYERDTKCSGTGLLRTNHPLRRQTLKAVDRLYPNGMAYILDVMVVDRKELWPSKSAVALTRL